MTPILVTYQEYCAIMFSVTLMAMFGITIEIFKAPHERT